MDRCLKDAMQRLGYLAQRAVGYARDLYSKGSDTVPPIVDDNYRETRRGSYGSQNVPGCGYNRGNDYEDARFGLSFFSKKKSFVPEY